MSFPKYLWESKWQIVLIVLLAIVFVVLLVLSVLNSRGWSEIWLWMEPFLAFSTVIVAIFIWLNEKRENWENTLPKRLDVCFCLPDEENEPIYEVKNAPLAGIGDIRPWGQQIGQQMNNNERLSFNGFRVDAPITDTDKNHRFVVRYKLTVWLQTHDQAKSRKIWKYDDEGKLCYAGQPSRTKVQERQEIP
jgi:hypothetical protein